jgi:hypothetical protein
VGIRDRHDRARAVISTACVRDVHVRSESWPNLGRRRTPFRKGTLESQVAQFWKTLHIDYTTQLSVRGVQNCTTGIVEIAFDARLFCA